MKNTELPIMKRKLQLVFVTAYLGGTHGTAKSARDFLRAWLANRTDVKVVSPAREKFSEQLCGFSLSSPIWLTPPDNSIRLPRRLWNLRPSNIKAWIREQIVRYQFSNHVCNSLTIVNGWASYEYWLSMESYFIGRRVLIVRESPRHFDNPDRGQSVSEIVSVFSKFDHLIFVSERVKSEWMQNTALKQVGYSVLPNCCEEEEATECLSLDRNMLRAQYGFSPEDFIVFCPGTVEHRKGQDLLLKIVTALQKSIPNIKILFVGYVATDWGRNLLLSIPAGMQGTTVIHWNAIPGILDLLRAVDILAFPSRAEALPRTILEAMAMKTPIVASSVDGVPELIETGRTGLLFDCEDSDGLFNGILSLHSDPFLREKFAEAGFSRYWNNFSRMHQFNRMKTILNELQNPHA